MTPSGGGFSTDAESHSTRGPIDGDTLLDFLEVFERVEPMATGELNDWVNPTELRIHLDEGITGATDARIDVRWTTNDDYNVHYTDSDATNLRWDVHPHDYPRPPDFRHFHPPPDASTVPGAVAPSCIEVAEVELVARAVHYLWRRAYDRRSVDGINTAENPP